MNEFDNDNDELDNYSSSSNSFRARSNTWPLNKPDLAAPSSNACIDETLPEIELEEDDLFTTNDSWAAGFVDHDIMSWDPILNAQNQQQQQGPHQPPIIHHQPQQSATTNHLQQINLHQTSQGHHRQQSIHLNHQQIQIHAQQQPQHVHQQPHRHHQHVSSQSVAQQHQHTHQQASNPQQGPLHESHQCSDATYLDAATGIVMGAANNAPIQQAQAQRQHQQISHVQQEHQLQQQQQTLNSSHCLDTDDANEYHINRLHHLHLDGPTSDKQQENYATSLASGPGNNVAALSPSQMSSMGVHPEDQSHDFGMSLSSDQQQQQQHHQHQHQLNQHPPHQHQQQSHLQPLTSAGYDYDSHQQIIQHHQQNDYDIKLAQDDNPNSQHQNHHHHLNHLEHHSHHQQTNTHQHHQYDHHPQQQQHIQSAHHLHQYHDITASSPDNGLGGSHLLSSSLSTSGIGLNADLEDLDFKSVNPSSILPTYDEPLRQHQIQQDQFQQSELQSNSSELVKIEIKSSSSTSSSGKLTDSNSASKTKLNAPRRNAWGNMSYADLISQAIESTNDKRLTLSQIYDWMVQHVPYFKDKGDSNSSAGWKNSVRHNLSLHSRFKRLQNEGTGKSSWWTINPEANIGKCARRRAASMEASKYEKKRGRAKKRAEAIRQGLVSYPSLTNSSLNGSTNTLGEQQSQAQSISHLQAPAVSATTSATTQPDASISSMKQKHNLQTMDQFANQQQQSQQTHMPQLQIQKLENHKIDQPSEQQQQHLRQLQHADYNSRTTIQLLL